MWEWLKKKIKNRGIITFAFGEGEIRLKKSELKVTESFVRAAMLYIASGKGGYLCCYFKEIRQEWPSLYSDAYDDFYRIWGHIGSMNGSVVGLPGYFHRFKLVNGRECRVAFLKFILDLNTKPVRKKK